MNGRVPGLWSMAVWRDGQRLDLFETFNIARTFQIRGISLNSRKWPFEQNDVKLIKTPIHPEPMSCGFPRLQAFCMTCGFVFMFWPSKPSKIIRKTPANKCQTPSKSGQTPANSENHTTEFSRTHLITSFTAKPITNASSLRNSLKLLKFWTLLENKKC